MIELTNQDIIELTGRITLVGMAFIAVTVGLMLAEDKFIKNKK